MNEIKNLKETMINLMSEIENRIEKLEDKETIAYCKGELAILEIIKNYIERLEVQNG